MGNPSPSVRPLRVLIDTNVLLDLLLQRSPWFAQAQPFWQAHDTGHIKAYFPASSLTDAYFIGTKQVGRAASRQGIEWCLQELGFISVTYSVLQAAYHIAGPDFEDDLIIACAQRGRCDYLATRDRAGFQHSPIPAYEPPAIVALLNRAP